MRPGLARRSPMPLDLVLAPELAVPPARRMRVRVEWRQELAMLLELRLRFLTRMGLLPVPGAPAHRPSCLPTQMDLHRVLAMQLP
jgi:hypothetical protein